MNLMNLMEESNSSSGLLFSELKGYCLQLLHLLQNPPNNQNHNSIIIFDNLVAFIRQSSSHHLQHFFDYTLFPLVLLLEAAVECRNNPPPLKISDAVAEGVLRCLEHLLIKCQVPSLDQMVVHFQYPLGGVMQSGSHYMNQHQQAQQMSPQALMAACSSMLYSQQQYSSLQQQAALHIQIGRWWKQWTTHAAK